MLMVILSQASERRKVQRLDTTHLKIFESRVKE